MAVSVNDIKHFLVLGGGTLGLRVALQAALSGFQTVVYEINEKAIFEGKLVQQKILSSLQKQEKISDAEAKAALSRLSWTDDPSEATHKADFVNESVTENLELKRKIWKQFGELCPAHTIFTTNTSYLLPSQFAEATGRPELFCAFHFHDVFNANVVDIMPHPGTAPWLIGLLEEMGKKLRQTPIVVRKESSGYVFNAMLMALIGAAGGLATAEIASIQDIDRSWMGNFKMKVGPFGIIDQVGLDTAWHILQGRTDTKSMRFAALLKSYIDKGKLGIKSREGFYTYPKPAFAEEGFVEGSWE